MISETTAQDWYGDRYQSVYVSRNRWLVTAITALTLAALQALALVLLVPLKTAVPFLIKEEMSGAVTQLTPLKGDGSITFDESTQKYFLAQYIIKRETYDPADLAENCRAVSLMSDPDTAREFNRLISDTNTHSPIVEYGKRAKRFIRVKSISFLNDHIAQIRLTATEQRNSSVATESQWVAIAGFKFGPAPGLESERLINPLGFFVTSYRIDQEVVP